MVNPQVFFRCADDIREALEKRAKAAGETLGEYLTRKGLAPETPLFLRERIEELAVRTGFSPEAAIAALLAYCFAVIDAHDQTWSVLPDLMLAFQSDDNGPLPADKVYRSLFKAEVIRLQKNTDPPEWAEEDARAEAEDES